MIQIDIDNKFIIKYTLILMLVISLTFLLIFNCKLYTVANNRVKDYSKYIQSIPGSIRYDINRKNVDNFITTTLSSIESNTFKSNGVLCTMGMTVSDTRNIDFKHSKIIFNVTSYSKDYVYEIKCVEYRGKRYIFKFVIDCTTSKFKLDRLYACRVYK